MIPKKIHYCWLSKEKISKVAKKCISTWRKLLPDYDFVLWNTENFDINSVPFVKQAFEAKKWAGAADYIRLYAVYNEGGIYLDTDVYLLKSFNDLLHYDFFSSLERDLTTVPQDSNYYKYLKQNENANYKIDALCHNEGYGLQAAVFGASKGNKYIKDCMEWYENNSFLLENGETMFSKQIIAPDVYAYTAQKYGFKYIQGFQQLENNMVILPADHFPNGIHKTDNAYAVHVCENSWTNLNKYSNNNFKKNISQSNICNALRKILGKKPYLSWEKTIKNGGKYKEI